MIYLRYFASAIATSIGVLPFSLVFALIIYWFINLFLQYIHGHGAVPLKSKKLNAFFSSCPAGYFTAHLSSLGGSPVYSGSVSGVIITTGHVLATFFTFIVIAIYVQRKAKKATQPEKPVNEQLLKCEYCNKIFRLNDYRNDVDRIYCTSCKAELKRSMSYLGIYTEN